MSPPDVDIPETRHILVDLFRRDFDSAAAEHPPSDELAAHVDGDLDEYARDMITAHLEMCASCAIEYAELVDLRHEIAGPKRFTREWLSRWMSLAVAAALLIVIGVSSMYRRAPVDAPPLAAPVAAAAPHDPVVDAALASGTLPIPPKLSTLRGSMGTLMGTETTAPFSIVTPAGIVTTDDRPIFQWTARHGATSYRVTVLDAHHRIVAESPALLATMWRPEEPLRRGGVYAWQVVAVAKDGSDVAPAPPLPQARFEIVDVATLERLRAARETRGSTPLVMAILEAQEGLLLEAAEDLQKYAADHPESAIARTLLADLNRRRR